jgi:hypothetical protein
MSKALKLRKRSASPIDIHVWACHSGTHPCLGLSHRYTSMSGPVSEANIHVSSMVPNGIKNSVRLKALMYHQLVGLRMIKYHKLQL